MYAHLICVVCSPTPTTRSLGSGPAPTETGNKRTRRHSTRRQYHAVLPSSRRSDIVNNTQRSVVIQFSDVSQNRLYIFGRVSSVRLSRESCVLMKNNNYVYPHHGLAPCPTRLLANTPIRDKMSARE